MTKFKSQFKAAAASYVPQPKKQVIGDIQRELTRIETENNDRYCHHHKSTRPAN